MNPSEYLSLTFHVTLFVLFYPFMFLKMERELGVIVMRTRVVDGVPIKEAAPKNAPECVFIAGWCVLFFIYELFMFSNFWLDQAKLQYFGG